MKKVFSTVSMAMMALVSLVSFTSCDKSDSPAGEDWKSAQIVVKTSFSQGILDLCDVTLNVTDFKGNTQSITPEAGDKSYTFSTTSKSGVAKLSYSCKVKSTVKPDGQSYGLTQGCTILYGDTGLDGGYRHLNTVSPTVGTVSSLGFRLKDEEAVTLLKKSQEKTAEYTFTLKDGTFVQIN